MEFFIEIVFEFVFEAVFDLAFDKSVKFPIRMTILSLFTVFFLGIGGAMLMGGISAMTRNISFAIVFSSIGIFVIYGYWKLIKKAQDRVRVKNESTSK